MPSNLIVPKLDSNTLLVLILSAISSVLFAVFAITATTATANAATSGANISARININTYDFNALQRGARIYVDYCAGCHNARFVRFGRMSEDLKIPPQLMKEYLMPPEAKLSDTMNWAVEGEQALSWFSQAAPPDLSLIAQVRGIDWLYAYLTSFYRDENQPTGWNNKIFPNVAMINVFASLQGEQRLSEDNELYIAPEDAGSLQSVEYRAMIIDLLTFMSYMSDPNQNERERIGYFVLAFLMILLILTYLLYKEYFADIKFD